MNIFYEFIDCDRVMSNGIHDHIIINTNISNYESNNSMNKVIWPSIHKLLVFTSLLLPTSEVLNFIYLLWFAYTNI